MAMLLPRGRALEVIPEVGEVPSPAGEMSLTKARAVAAETLPTDVTHVYACSPFVGSNLELDLRGGRPLIVSPGTAQAPRRVDFENLAGRRDLSTVFIAPALDKPPADPRIELEVGKPRTPVGLADQRLPGLRRRGSDGHGDMDLERVSHRLSSRP